MSLRQLFRSSFVLCVLTTFLASYLESQTCPPPDVPDSLYQDTNLDGIDGDTSHAIFVSGTAGNDANPGTMVLPVATVQHGIQLAQAAGKDVYVAGGIYTLSTPLQMASGVSLYGQYSGPPSWSRSASNVTTMLGVSPVIEANGINLETHIEGFNITAPAATVPSQSSYGIHLINDTGMIVIRYNTIIVGKGADGSAGVNGLDGQIGGAGGPGNAGSCDGNFPVSGGLGGGSTCGLNGGNGGGGGVAAQDGFPGQTGSGTGGPGGIGGSGGPWGNPGGSGSSGSNGSAGSNGATGASASPLGTIALGFYVAASGDNGTSGTEGRGGGGGGGGGGQSCFFCDDGSGNSGGGGGAGGCAGTLGTGGGGGGGSFGVFVVSTSVSISGNSISTGSGGNAGNGGSGGMGGSGGQGALGGTSCTGEIGAGGNGGNGGNGGTAGSGSGGTGGPSAGVFVSGVSNVFVGGNTITHGSPGLGGVGGGNLTTGVAPNGFTGISSDEIGPVFPLPTVTPIACINDITVQEPASGTINATFTVVLSQVTTDSVTISFLTHDSTALAGSDYTSASGSITFPPGVLMKQIDVQIQGDALPEPTEYLGVILYNPQHATLSHSEGVGTILDNPARNISLNVNPEWNLVSIPATAGDMSASSLFPGATSPLLSFSPILNYQSADSASVGKGYWIRFPSAGVVNFAGSPVVRESINVVAGWNLFGTIAETLSAGALQSVPPGILIGKVFTYLGSYQHASTLQPGMGYWVKSDSNGVIILSSGGHASPKALAVYQDDISTKWNGLIVQDARGMSQRLAFVDKSLLGSTTLSSFDLPPVPPPGSFDVRFGNQRSVVAYDRRPVQEFPIRFSTRAYPVTFRFDWKGTMVGVDLVVDGKSCSNHGMSPVTVMDSQSTVVLKISSVSDVPAHYSLALNYPNPFNPSTVISYDLPEDSHVTLKIYNLLGQEVQSLISEVQSAGFKRMSFNAEKIPSGVYFYRLQAVSMRHPGNKFSGTGKMILMK